jgi:hypothetical protein
MEAAIRVQRRNCAIKFPRSASSDYVLSKGIVNAAVQSRRLCELSSEHSTREVPAPWLVQRGDHDPRRFQTVHGKDRRTHERHSIALGAPRHIPLHIGTLDRVNYERGGLQSPVPKDRPQKKWPPNVLDLRFPKQRLGTAHREV